MFKAPFSFNGRIRRLEYGLSFLIYVVVVLGMEFGMISTQSGNGQSSILFLLFIVPCIWFMLAQGAKRSHDLGNSGWFILIPFYALWLLFADSKSGMNEYGPNPKGIGNEDRFSFEEAKGPM